MVNLTCAKTLYNSKVLSAGLRSFPENKHIHSWQQDLFPFKKNLHIETFQFEMSVCSCLEQNKLYRKPTIACIFSATKCKFFSSFFLVSSQNICLVSNGKSYTFHPTWDANLKRFFCCNTESVLFPYSTLVCYHINYKFTTTLKDLECTLFKHENCTE